MKQLVLKNNIILLSILISLSTLFSAKPPQANAQAWIVMDPTLIGVTTTGFSTIGGQLTVTNSILSGALPGQAQKEGGVSWMGWDGVGYLLGNIALRQLSQSVVNWINSGFEGNPSFIQDPEKFLTDTADRVAGEFIYSSKLAGLCTPFKINILQSLNLLYSPYADKINCTLSGVLDNINDATGEAYNNFISGDFIEGGGWDSWLTVTTVPQNNQIGAMLIAQGQLDAEIETQKGTGGAELNWGSGLLSYKECTQTQTDAKGVPTGTPPVTYRGNPAVHASGPGPWTSGTTTNQQAGPVRPGETLSQTYTSTKCKTVTPGTAIRDSLFKAHSTEFDRLGAADEINEILGALTNFMIGKIMDKGLLGSSADANQRAQEDANWRNSYNGQIGQQQEIVANIANSNGNNQGLNAQDINVDSTAYNGGTVDQTLNNNKNDIQLAITADTLNEQNYLAAYSQIYTAADTMETKFLGIVTCYNAKLATTTITLTSVDRQVASSSIAQASTTASQMAGIKTSVTPNIFSAQNNLASLQIVSSAVSTATTPEALTAATNNLNTIPLHTSTQAAEAQVMSATTTSQIMSNDPIANTMTQACSVFPSPVM